jgi:hypothetical protein
VSSKERHSEKLRGATLVWSTPHAYHLSASTGMRQRRRKLDLIGTWVDNGPVHNRELYSQILGLAEPERVDRLNWCKLSRLGF